MPKTNRQLATKRSKLTILLSVLISIIILLLVKNFFFHNKKTIDPNEEWETRLPTIQQKMPDTPSPEVQDINSQASSKIIESDKEKPSSDQCSQTAEVINQFVTKLENKPYIKAYEIKEPLINHINKIIIKLLNNPPVVAQETDNLFTVLKNTAHFYRILGHKDLSLVKDIIANEYNDIEHIWAQIYQWSTLAKKCKDSTLHLALPIKKTYEYAVFFLNTLGGQSYLFRRDSHLRILTRYYCLLLLNQAAQQSLNYHTLDLAYTLESVSEDVHNADSLEYQDEYTATLQKIKENFSK